MDQRDIQATLRTCSIEAREDRDFIVETVFGDSSSFALVNLDVFAALKDCLAVAGCRVPAG